MPDVRRISMKFIRGTDRIFDSVGVRPLGICVFSLSVFLLVNLVSVSQSVIRVEAVAIGEIVHHPALVASFATEVFVKQGDRVGIGTPLVELSPHFIDQRIGRLDSQMEQLINESKLAQAQLLVKEERWVAPGLRLRPNRPSLEDPTSDFYAKQIESLRTRRDMLLSDRDSLLIKSNFEGIVKEVTRVGSSFAEGDSVASIMPEFAQEIVAFVAPTTDPEAIATGALVRIAGATGPGCSNVGMVRRRGATVREAPAQLRNFFGSKVHGMPIHVSVPPSCRLGNGQIVTLDFTKSGVS